MQKLCLAAFVLIATPALAQSAADAETPFAASFAEPGLPPLAVFANANGAGAFTASVPLPVEGQSLFVYWREGNAPSLLHAHRDGSSVSAFGRAAPGSPVGGDFDLNLTPGATDQTPLEVLVYPDHGLVLYRWPGSDSVAPGGVPTAELNPLALGSHFPDLVLTGLDGRPVRLGDYRGRPVVLNWWSGTCTWCVVELPGLNSLVERYGDRVAFVAVGWDPAAEVEAFLAARPFAYEQTLGDERATALFEEVFPRHVVLDADGRVVYDKVGGSAEVADELAPVIEGALGG